MYLFQPLMTNRLGYYLYNSKPSLFRSNKSLQVGDWLTSPHRMDYCITETLCTSLSNKHLQILQPDVGIFDYSPAEAIPHIS